jgi:erythromycin esterase
MQYTTSGANTVDAVLKHRLLEYCVSQLGFRIFGIEARFPESLRVNDYVLHGRGDPTEALAGMRSWTWDTERCWR